MVRRRTGFKQVLLEQRFKESAADLRQLALDIPPGETKAALLRKADQLEAGCHMAGWLQSAGLDR